MDGHNPGIRAVRDEGLSSARIYGIGIYSLRYIPQIFRWLKIVAIASIIRGVSNVDAFIAEQTYSCGQQAAQ